MAQHPTEEKVTARVIFVGVMFGCINTDKEKNRRYEIGMIKCEKHSPQIWITKDGTRKEFKWRTVNDLIFKVVNPKKKGISKYLSSPGDDPASFSFVLDVEGKHLHENGVKVNQGLLKGRRIGVTDGTLYAHQLTKDLNLMTWRIDGEEGKFKEPFGKIAKQVGLNIVCRKGDDSGIKILDAVTGALLHWMPADPDESYTIEVNNDCNRDLPEPIVKARGKKSPTDAPSPLPPGASDFRFNYQVITPVNLKDPKFDFQLSNDPKRNPDVCNPSGGRKTSTIGFDWSKA